MRLSLLGVAVLALAVVVGETEAAKVKGARAVPRPGMKIQGRLRMLDWKTGQVQVMTGSGLRRFSAPSINVITPGGQVQHRGLECQPREFADALDLSAGV